MKCSVHGVNFVYSAHGVNFETARHTIFVGFIIIIICDEYVVIYFYKPIFIIN